MRAAGNILRPLHRDDRGVLSILALLTLMALVALVGLVYNASEYASRRRHVQAAADSAAHSAAMWISRTTNTIAGTNQLIVENASAEVILRSAQRTAHVILSRITSEKRRIERELQRITDQRRRNDQRSTGPDPNTALRLELKEAVLLAILDQYRFQEEIYRMFVDRTSPAMGTTPDMLAQRRQAIRDYQAEVMYLTGQAVEEQRLAIAEFYKCEVVLARPDGGPLIAPLKKVGRTNFDAPVHVGNFVMTVGRDLVPVLGGSWGTIPCPPLRRFFNDRVSRDEGRDRNDSLVPILSEYDQQRQRIHQLIIDMTTPPPDATPAIEQIYLRVRQEILAMNLHERFAVRAFHDAVSHFRSVVLWQLGEIPQHTLATYDLYPIPDWARDGVRQSAYRYVYERALQRNWRNIYNWKYRQLIREGMDRAQARREATQYAHAVAPIAAGRVAEIASEIWIRVPWPYEITPPPSPHVTWRITRDDRHEHFTLLSAAMTTDQTNPRPVLTKLMNTLQTPLVACAQAESANWMEYHGRYGGGNLHAKYTQAFPPPPWRISTAGGWNWQPRLAFSDALGRTILANEHFAAFFEQAGMGGGEAGAFDEAVQH